MKIFLDSDVIIDFLTGRSFYLQEIKVIMDKGIRKELELYTSSLIIANIHYFISKISNPSNATKKIDMITQFVNILNVGENEILGAIKSRFKDFEDSIQNECAINADLRIIVTRNAKDFKLSTLSILTPGEFIAKINYSS